MNYSPFAKFDVSDKYMWVVGLYIFIEIRGIHFKKIVK